MEENNYGSNANFETNGNCAAQFFLPKIANIELMVSEFAGNIQQELHQLKECARVLIKNKKKPSVPNLKVHEAISSKTGEYCQLQKYHFHYVQFYFFQFR